ncbi:MAG: hypothetical protein QM710_14270 [Flavobacterium sp.]
MDDITDYDNLNLSLGQIIENSKASDWRQYFIAYPEILAHCGTNKFVRFGNDDDSDDILLLEKLQTNGNNREYYTFALYCELKKRGNKAGYYFTNGVEYAKYISSINGIKIDITFNYFKSGHYCIEYEKEEEAKIYFVKMEEVLEYLKNQKIIS